MGKARAIFEGSAGMVTQRNVPDYGYLYTTSLVQAPDIAVGDLRTLPDGREYRYAKSAAACLSCQGCEFTTTGLVAYTAFAVSAAVGVQEVTVPAATHALQAKDALRGGYVIIWAADGSVQFRGIVGNDATAADVAFKIRLDAGLTNAVVAATSAIELYENPYAALQTAADPTKAVAGVPAAAVAAASTYFWVQTKGPVFVNPAATVTGNEGVGCMWRHDGSLDAVATAIGGTVPDTDTTQYAGYRIEGSADGNGPLFMLT